MLLKFIKAIKLNVSMTLLVISRVFQFEFVDVRLCFEKNFFPVFDHKLFVDDYVFDAVLCV